MAQSPVLAAEAGSLALGSTVSGNITESNEYDQYTIYLSEPGRLSVMLTSRISYVYIQWLDGDYKEIKRSTVGSGSESSPKVYQDEYDLEAGTYYIKVYKYSNYTGRYDLKADFKAAGNNEAEPNNAPEQAQSMSFGQTATGYISYQDDTDYYRYVLIQPGRLSVTLTSRTNYVYVQWLDSEYKEIERDPVGSGSESSPKIYTESYELEAGVYYIRVYKYSSNYTGTYDVKADFKAAGNNELEPNNTPEQAQTIGANQAVTGYISYQDDTDYYKFVTTQTGKLTVKLTSRLNYVYIQWLDSDFKEIKRTSVGSGSESNPKIYTETRDLEAGTYYLRIYKYSSSYTGVYDLTITGDAIVTNPGTSPTPPPTTSPTTPPTNPPSDGTSSGASDWAKAEIDRAIELGIVPKELLNSYQSDITRAEFCKMVVIMLMAKSGTVTTEDRFVSAFNINLAAEPFTDTSDRYIKIAYELRIVNGTGNNRFAPNDPITRQEAATMLSRAAAVFEFTTYTGSPLKFADENAIATWAKSPVDFISANGIMQGTGGDMFSPHVNYNREQAILTMLRLFNAFPREYYPI